MCPSHPSLGGGGTTSPSAWQPPSQSRRDTGSPDWGCQEKERERGGDRFPLDKGPRGGSFGHLESVAWVELGLDGGVDLVGSRIGASSILAVEPSDALGRRLGHPPPVGGFREPISHSWRPPDTDSKDAHQVGWRRCVEWRGTRAAAKCPTLKLQIHRSPAMHICILGAGSAGHCRDTITAWWRHVQTQSQAQVTRQQGMFPAMQYHGS